MTMQYNLHVDMWSSNVLYIDTVIYKTKNVWKMFHKVIMNIMKHFPFYNQYIYKITIHICFLMINYFIWSTNTIFGIIK